MPFVSKGSDCAAFPVGFHRTRMDLAVFSRGQKFLWLKASFPCVSERNRVKNKPFQSKAMSEKR